MIKLSIFLKKNETKIINKKEIYSKYLMFKTYIKKFQ